MSKHLLDVILVFFLHSIYFAHADVPFLFGTQISFQNIDLFFSLRFVYNFFFCWHCWHFQHIRWLFLFNIFFNTFIQMLTFSFVISYMKIIWIVMLCWHTWHPKPSFASENSCIIWVGWVLMRVFHPSYRLIKMNFRSLFLSFWESVSMLFKKIDMWRNGMNIKNLWWCFCCCCPCHRALSLLVLSDFSCLFWFCSVFLL